MKRYKLFATLLLTILIISGGQVSFAADPAVKPLQSDISGTAPKPDVTGTAPAPKSSYIENPLNADNIEKLLLGVADLAIFIGMIAAVLVFIYIGFQFVMAQGDPKKITDAKTWFLWAVVGTAILIGSKVIVEVVQNTFIQSGLVNEKNIKK